MSNMKLVTKKVSKKLFSKTHIVFACLIAFNLYLSTWLTLQGDVDLNADVARDFLLQEELIQKKIVLIGARSGTSGIFHGPAWTYLNAPMYRLGNGNPTTVAWFWIFLSFTFVVTSYLLAKKLTNNTTGLLYAVLLSGNMIFLTNPQSHSHGALFLMPSFIFTIIMYTRTKKWYFLAIHFVVASLMVQFQMAAGLPMLAISLVYSFYFIKKHGNQAHFLTFALVPLILSNFFLFELRHEFGMIRSVLLFSKPASESVIHTYWFMLQERLDKLLSLQISPGLPVLLSGFLSAIVWVTTLERKDKRRTNADIFTILPTYFICYLILSFVNKGYIQGQQFLPILPLTNLWFAVTVTQINNKKIWLLVMLVITFNFIAAFKHINELKENYIGLAQSSWKFQKSVVEKITNRGDREFGYFVYAPDIFGYTQRYVAGQVFRVSGVNAHEYSKQPITYIIAAPAPTDRPDLNYDWWRKYKVGINVLPQQIWTFPNGYTVERFELSKEEQDRPWDEAINVGLHFR